MGLMSCMGGAMSWMWGAWSVGTMLIALVFWAGVAAAAVLGIRWMVTQSREARSESALEILRQRYARGEINREDFEARKHDLQRR